MIGRWMFASHLYTYRELLWNLVVRNLKIRYKNSSLGFLWTFLNPVFLILIYYTFIRLMRFDMDLTGLLAGVIPWHFLSMTLGDSVESISGNSTLITKVRFPRIILPLSIVLANCINYALSLFVLILFLPLLGCPFTFRLLWLPALLILIFIFIMGLSLFVATCNVYFKDTPHLLSVALMAWFFLTPIIYPLTQIPERFRGPAFINPMAAVITLYRYAITGQSFDFTPWMGGGIALIFLFFILGAHVFYRFERVFADML